MKNLQGQVVIINIELYRSISDFILKNKGKGNKELFYPLVSIIVLLSLFCLPLNKSIKGFRVFLNNKYLYYIDRQ
jgi:hypothetical protein